jgi:pimeloyl-ACP methyl ester carboxylesterase
VGYLRRLCRYWAEEFDWRSEEERINRFAHFTMQLGGEQVHFVHQRAADGNGIPIVLTHGWPSTFLEYLPVVDLLTDPRAHGIDGPSFDVVIPSLPGYAFSSRPASQPADYRYVAGQWHRLMQGLGYERYAAGGGDFGSGIATYMALLDPERMLGIYLSHLEIQPTLDEREPLLPHEARYLKQNSTFWNGEGGYFEIQSTKPQTLGFALNDSPTGLAAWIVEKWQAWADTNGDIESRFDFDFLLSNITLYWVTQSITSSMRDYFDDRDWFNGVVGVVPASDARVAVPVGFSTWPAYAQTEGVPPRSWAERLYNIVHWTDMPAGGHFAATEEPLLYASDLAAFFAALDGGRR